MKKLIILAAFAITGLVANAQKGFHAGLKFIPQNTWIMNKDLSDRADFRHKTTFRFAFGGSLDYHFSDKTGVGIDLLYSPQGQKYTTCDDCPLKDEKYLWEVNYFKIPLLLHFNGDPESTVMFVGEVGPQLSILMKAEDENLGNTEDAFKKLNVGMVLGLGVGFNITDYLVATVKIRLDAGLSDAADHDWEVLPGVKGWDDEQRVWMLAGGLPEIGIKYVLRSDR